MQQNQKIKITKIHKVNSVDFITKVFELYQARKVFAISNESNQNLADKIGLVDDEILPKPGGGWVKTSLNPIKENIPAQITFSSGTQGEPKAIVLSHLALADVVERLNRLMQVDSSIKEYVGVPVTYSFGLGRCRAVATVGGSFYIPENGFNPTEIAHMLEQGEINAISAVPSLWRILLSQPQVIGQSGTKVRWIEIGSQWMSVEEKQQMKQLFPNACIVQHYGLTEASRTSLLEVSAVEGDKLDSVGIVDTPIEIKIDDNSNICIKGEHLALGELINGELKTLSNSDGWLVTRDSGKVSADGYLYFLGRTDDLINCSGIKVDPESLEREVNAKLDGEPVVLVGIKDEQRGEGFLAVKSNESQSDEQIKQLIHAELLLLGVNALSAIKVTYLSQLPMTETGKVKRKQIAQTYVPPKASKLKSGKVTGVINIYRSLFDEENMTEDDSFKSLGGDSLNYVQASVMLEQYLGGVPDNWDLMSIRELEKSKTKVKGFWTKIEMSIFLRALAILCVVATHSGIEVLGGGTLLLIFLVGFNMARFRFDDFREDGAWRSIFRYSITLLVPYYLLTIVYFAWNRSFEIDVILLYANLMIAKITVIFPFWFVQILVQCLVIIGLLFSIKSIRDKMKESPWLFSYIFLLGFIGIRILYPYIWETAHLNDLVPIRFIAHIWLGWCIYLCATENQKLITALTGVTFAFIDTGTDLETGWLIIGSLTLPYIRFVPVPSLFKRGLNAIAEATFYIFIFNGILIYLFIHIFKIDSSILAFFAGLIGSMVGWWILERKRIPAIIFNKLRNKKQPL
ncbi:AMP-binding protein [Aliikangiella sp. IMCC44359]|uniref:AMP-binding protein n=1 Tax=Aliikangiella sp. IMCC44359 TaxID=3459125 RepID=UPI00403ADE05